MPKKKRLKKKQLKQRTEQKLIQQGYSKKEVKNLPKNEVKKVEKQIVRNDTRRNQRQLNRNFIRKNNLTESYKHNGVVYKGSRLADLSPEVLQKFAKQQKEREYRRSLYERKKQQLINNGVPEELADSYKYSKKAFFEEALHKGDRTVYKSSEYLSVTWSDVTGESDYAHALNEYDAMTTKDMIAEIHNTYNESKSAPKGDSSGFKGVAKIITSSDEQKVKQQAKEAFKRGYNKGAVYEGTHLLTANEFTVRGYANMMLSVMNRAKPEHIQQYYAEFETYAYNNLPEIHKQIF